LRHASQVIKALYDYSAPDPSYLSFTQGDFLHVVDREDDLQWYEACNPLQGSRGLVPVSYFETVGKQARQSGGVGGSPNSDHYIPLGNHDSGYGTANATGSGPGAMNGARVSKSMSRGPVGIGAAGGGAGAMVYGVVMYDFKAERPDELDAKAGEAIIVIAQSNPEWFVAKPITRLGGPGLIPVSFIEIRDMATNQAVEDPQEAVRRAGVPKVEEWKKMAADYKNGSIPLGKLDAGPQNLTQGMSRLSVGNKPQQQPMPQQQQQQMQGGYGNPNGYGSGQVSIVYHPFIGGISNYSSKLQQTAPLINSNLNMACSNLRIKTFSLLYKPLYLDTASPMILSGL
jgi:bud emergence protein 1